MPRPTSSTTVQRPDLGAVAFEYLAEASHQGFIGLEIMPLFEVAEQSGDYPKIPIEALIKLPASIRRTPRGAYQRGDYEFETGQYSCEEYGWEEPLDDGELRMYARLFEAEEIATLRAMDIVLRHQEKRVAAIAQSTSIITGTGAVSTEWSVASGCTPKADVKDAIETQRASSGLILDGLAISWKVFNNLMVCAEIKDYLQYTNPHLLDTFEAQKAILANYFGVKKVVVGNAIYDSAKKGKTMSIADIWDDEYATLFKVATNARNLREPVVGRSFLWTGDSPQNIVVEEYREDPIRSNIYRVRQNIDEATVFSGAGYILSNITA